ncbi:unnamed protein product [Trichogramma brassicae]|uniref:NEDD8-activating enzyme E1 catalytic subunit n=1 Tax=Trichogramma brassicae TaxID=86971 RepID=A0A6H5IIJ7_9HYME|nr:unnamed protein product [Trichogramma brassicae]
MDEENLHRKLSSLRKILERSGPFCRPDFEPSPESLKFLMQNCKILVVGAGGLGCECLKNLALMGFRQMEVIDMDVIDLSNLNRQFLFRHKDIGKSKAVTAAKFINDRIPGCNVTPHFCRIQDKEPEFYKQFHIILCGLDSIIARRWINSMLTSLLVYNDDQLDVSSVIPLIDGGTEGFKGNLRVVLPGLTPCIECSLDLYPPQITYPLCTIANTPRLPEHCIEYVKVVQWPRENPFDCCIDGDDPQHITWIYEKSNDRALHFGIRGLTYRLVQGVIKNIIPAVASTNAIIASMCCTEVFKVATSCSASLNNYMVFSNTDGIYTFSYEAEKNENCLACSHSIKEVPLKSLDVKLKEFIDILKYDNAFQLKNPSITAKISGKNKTLYVENIASLEEQTRQNLSKSLFELGISNHTDLIVADSTAPSTFTFKVKVSD